MLDRLPLAIDSVRRGCGSCRPAAPAAHGRALSLPSARAAPAGPQATLRAALDWSWDLLTPAEKHVLAQLSIFESSWSLDAAERWWT
jgi:predicted ATPase